jgi:hypothetical protein
MAYHVPGIYSEIRSPTPNPQLQTGIPVFLGGMDENRIEFKKDVRIKTLIGLESWSQFQQYVGQPVAKHKGQPVANNAPLAAAVRGFFENGGQWCYVLLLAQMRLDQMTLSALDKALDILATSDQIDLICFPELSAFGPFGPLEDRALGTLVRWQGKILEHCDAMGDRFAILDPLEKATIDQLRKHRQKLEAQSSGALSSGALYTPWLKVSSLTESQTATGTSTVAVPPCGHVAGLFARSDQLSGVHRPPANLALEGVVDLVSPLSHQDFADLNLEQGGGVNGLRSFPGRGIRVWGVRTLSSGLEWRYIHVRRLFSTLSRWLTFTLADLAFEPNNFQLWFRIEREVSAYCESLLQQGALQGRNPQEAFYIKCDEETNPLEVQDRGEVVTEVGLAPITPSEFIVVQLVQSDSGVAVSAA